MPDNFNHEKERAFLALTPYDPTDEDQIKANAKSRSQGGRSFSYVSGATVIRQLCKIFPLGWRFEYEEPTFIPNVNATTGEALLTGTYRCDGRIIIKRFSMFNALGMPVSRDTNEMDDALILRDIGLCEMPNVSMLDTAMKGALTDCLKRCASQLGDQFGNSLYDGGEKDEDAPPPAPLSHASVHYPTKPNVPAHFRDDDDMPPDIGEAPQRPTPTKPITCRYDAVILSEAEARWCEDKRKMANGQIDYACRSCQMKQKEAGLGREA